MLLLGFLKSSMLIIYFCDVFISVLNEKQFLVIYEIVWAAVVRKISLELKLFIFKKLIFFLFNFRFLLLIDWNLENGKCTLFWYLRYVISIFLNFYVWKIWSFQFNFLFRSLLSEFVSLVGIQTFNFKFCSVQKTCIAKFWDLASFPPLQRKIYDFGNIWNSLPSST